MLQRSFTLFQGIGPGAEKKLQEAGIACWDDALKARSSLPLGKGLQTRLVQSIEKAKEELSRANTAYFTPLLKPKDGWRLFSTFPEKCLYYDLETTGLSPNFDQITTISTYSPSTKRLRTFVQGENLNEFVEELPDECYLVGFNNRAFDSRFLASTFGDRVPDTPQIDIRWILNGMGIKGGLKQIEEDHFHITRPESIRGFDGFQAVEAWMRWKGHGDRQARNKLIYYNQADVFVLDFLMREACRRNGCCRFKTPLAADLLFSSSEPEDWVNALPGLDSMQPVIEPDSAAQVSSPLTDDREPSLEPDVEPGPLAAEASREAHYRLMFFMALADECVTREERCVLDLFASKYGLSRREQEAIEHLARDDYENSGFEWVHTFVRSLSQEESHWIIQELAMFSWIDGHLDSREKGLLFELCHQCGLNEGLVEEVRDKAVQLGKELLLK